MPKGQTDRKTPLGKRDPWVESIMKETGSIYESDVYDQMKRREADQAHGTNNRAKSLSSMLVLVRKPLGYQTWVEP